MNLIEKIKAIEIYVCENFEELGLDDPVEDKRRFGQGASNL